MHVLTNICNSWIILGSNNEMVSNIPRFTRGKQCLTTINGHKHKIKIKGDELDDLVNLIECGC